MPSIEIEIPYEALRRPGVAKALADLAYALGGHATAAAAPEPAEAKPEAKPEPEPEAKPAPSPEPEPAPTAAPRARKPAKAAKAEKPTPPAEEPAPDTDARYAEFVDKLPDRSRHFLQLIRDRGTLTIADAMDELGVSVPKAMGGITGSIGRWAPVHGVTIPYEAVKVDGERAWQWSKPGDEPEEKPATEPKAAVPDAEPPEAAPETPAAEWDQFAADLPGTSRRFLELLQEKGTLTVDEAVEALGLGGPRAMGGLTGAMRRSAGRADLELPFDAQKGDDGKRIWVWRTE